MEIKYNQKDLDSICKQAIESYFLTKEDEVYEVNVKGMPLSVYYEKKKKEIIGQLDYDLLYFFFNLTFQIQKGEFVIEKNNENPEFSGKKEIIYKGEAYLAERKNKLFLVIKIPDKYEKIALETFKTQEENEEERTYSFDSSLLSLDKEAALIIMSDYGIGIRKNFIEPRQHFLSFLKARKVNLNPDCEFYKTINQTYQEIQKINNYTKEDYFNINKRRFVQRLLDLIVEKQNDTNFKRQFNRVVDCIASSSACEDITISMITYLEAMNSLDYMKDQTMHDFTKEAISLFKAAEILFYDLLIQRWDGFNFKRKDGKIEYKDIRNKGKTTLGDLSRVFYSTDKDVLQCLTGHNVYQINKLINDWINYDRNDHLHKDIMKAKEDLHDSLNSTINVIFELVDMFY